MVKVLFYLFLISIPLGTRILLYQFTTGFHEYETIFIYLSDVLLVLFLAAHALIYGRIAWKKPKFLIIFLLLAAFSIIFAYSTGLAVYNLARLLLYAYAALAIADILKIGIVKLEGVFGAIAGLAVFQSIIGFLQFAKQSSLGLGFLGEPVLGPAVGGAAHPSPEAMEGIAKIVVEGAKVLRAYGTFAHPNILAAFLLLGLLSLYFFWLRRPSEGKWFSSFKNLISDLLIGVGIFITATGLLLAFSRAAWAIAGLITVLIIIYALISGKYFRQGVRLAVLVLASCLLLLVSFSSYVLPRAQISSDEPAVSYRLAYNELAVDLIKTEPWGVGVGNQVLYSVKKSVYQKFGMDQVWQWQPIHNIYLLVAAETGILGGIAFVLFLLSLFIKFRNSLPLVACFLLLASLLLFGLFDHFLWTLQPGRLMLWLTIGLVLSLNNAIKRS